MVAFVMRKDGEEYELLVCLLIMAMDIVAGILGIEAEIAQNKTSSLKMWIFECRGPSHGAFKLGLSMAVLLVVAHALTNLLGGCMCVWSKEELSPGQGEQATGGRLEDVEVVHGFFCVL